MSEDFSSRPSGLTSPARDAFAITPSNTVPLPQQVRGVYVGGSGNLRVLMVSGVQVDFTGVLAGAVYPIRLSQVMATGTTATGLVGLL